MSGANIQCRAVRFSRAGMEFTFDFSVDASDIVAVMGPSGSGKSTLLDLIAGFETPQSGAIRIGNADVAQLPPAQRPVSMVFQENNLFGHLDVFSNVALGRSPSLKLDDEDRADVHEAIERVGLAGKDKRLPPALSGGERQRVALARVLVRDRPVLLLDEPFASLGPALRREMVELVQALHAERGMTVLMATHHPDDAERLATRMIYVEEGAVAAQGPAAEFFGEDAPDAFQRYLGSERRG
ncbi:MAG: thiamine ABC transporter ATP-binding protein [Rhizobiaceae bacterium]|nr:thiamine ABC transporter ATP-binding protein [Rhizobiaceae bacterium]